MTAARRTQQERRESTIALLVDATIETIAEVGYHRASLGAVLARAGVSKGGLFRHFESRLDLVVAAAAEVSARHLAAFDALEEEQEELTVEELLRFSRAEARAPINTVWFELLVAARTDGDLRARLAPVAAQLYADIEERALRVLPRRSLDDDGVRLLTTSLLHMFDGEAIIRHTLPRPELEEARLSAAAAMVEWLREGRPAGG
ncbi:MAG TPA: helix-turn-helix domain-containing protein [Nocardioidaceae bacterium]|nr:helix-turn-helix domain-containing protein [Nocardioidaceae bacterium]